jgi:hypothetical protein
MATIVDLPLYRDSTMIWDGVAQKRVQGVWENISLTGATVRLIVRKVVGDAAPVFEIVSGASTSDGSITPNADQVVNKGKYVLRIEAAATSAESEFPDDQTANYPFEIEVTEGTGEKTKLARGFIKYSPDVR